MSIPKPSTYRNLIYLQFVRSLPCCVCGMRQRIEAHHSEKGGIGIKGSDAFAIPFCQEHHWQYHNKGKVSFYQEYGLDRWEIVARTLEKYLIKEF